MNQEKFSFFIRSLKRSWPLFLAVSAYLGVIVILLAISLTLNHGVFTYALDDAYIHLSMAKNFALHHVWGVTAHEFSYSSSSLLWTVLLSILFTLFGVHVSFPFLLNVLLSIGIITTLYFFLEKRCGKKGHLFFILLAFIFITPLPALTFSGMEHLLHILLSLIFISLFAHTVAAKKSRTFAQLPLLFCSILLVLSRFEGFFLIFAAALYLLWQKRYRLASTIALVSVLPVLIFGLLSVTHGWDILPTSLLIKSASGSLPDFSYFLTLVFYTGVFQFLFSPQVSLFILFTLYIFIHKKSEIRSREDKLLFVTCVLFSITAILHLFLASTENWFYRYEAYLVVLGIFTVSLIHQNIIDRLKGILFPERGILHDLKIGTLLFFFTIPFLYRTANSLYETPLASHNIFQQQYQVATFLHNYYDNANVMLNDIGSPSFYSDIHIVDLVGLGSREVAQLQISGNMSTHQLQTLADTYDLKIAALYAGWLNKCFPSIPRTHSMRCEIPNNWIAVGQLKIEHNVVDREDTVIFFAFNPDDAGELSADLLEFSRQLPPDVSYNALPINYED